MPRVSSIHPRLSLQSTLPCGPIMFPCKSFRSNTSKILRKCSFQKTYGKAKSFRSNTYKKTGGPPPSPQSQFSSRLPPNEIEGLQSSGVPSSFPLSSRWNPVAQRRKTPSISFPCKSLPDSFLHNEGGYTPPPHQFRSFPGTSTQSGAVLPFVHSRAGLSSVAGHPSFVVCSLLASSFFSVLSLAPPHYRFHPAVPPGGRHE